MKSLKGTQTERNILTAFAGESQARNRYDYFAGAAKKDGFVQIADIFTETALQEKEHAKRLFKFLEGGDVELTAAGEHHEYTEMYPSFANIADSEGFSEVACVMRNIAIAEQYHEERFLAFAKNIKEGRVFVRETPVVWRCRNCGCLVTGTHAPALCPACAHPTAHFEVLHNPW